MNIEKGKNSGVMVRPTLVDVSLYDEASGVVYNATAKVNFPFRLEQLPGRSRMTGRFDGFWIYHAAWSDVA